MIKSPPHRFARRRPDAGMALVICLALLVLITAAVMAFFARATENRVVESSRMHRVKTEQLGQSAADYVVGQFLQEISDPANSTVKTVDGQVIYQPKAAANAVPRRSISAGVSTNDENYFNLVRQSVPSADTNATATSSAIAAKNGRLIAPARWNAPYLLGGTGFGAVNQLPNWIYVNADGAITTTVTTNVSGRFAYNVYNVGGLLDANVAGYPSTLNASELAAIKGTLAGADLKQLGLTQTGVDALISFRNAASTTASAYTNMVAKAAGDGFNFRDGTTYHNNLFTTRQDLIRYALSQNNDLTNALPYLGTFIQGSATPSFEPDATRAKATGDYVGKDDQVNPSLLIIRATKSFTRMDGSAAKIGEPLIKRRFPLDRLAWIGPDGPASGISADQIRAAFGLEYSGGKWNYVHGSGGAILTLDQIRDLSAAREPDFFELLQAGMHLGSMTPYASSNDAQDNAKYVKKREKILANQVLQVGANLIDQADENSNPTIIAFNGEEFYGIENLPYIYRVFMTPYRFHGPAQNTNLAGIWFMPEVWNPHAQASTPAPGSPTQFRFVATGRVRAAFQYNPQADPSSSTFAFSALKTYPDPASDPNAGIKFPGSGLFGQPTQLRPEMGAVASGNDAVTDGGAVNFFGLHAGTANVPDKRITNNPIHQEYGYATVSFDTPLDFLLQYWNGSKWVTYNRVPSVDIGAFDGARVPMFQGLVPASFYSLIDPRTSRFGTTVGFVDDGRGPADQFGPGYVSGQTQRPGLAIGAQRHGGLDKPWVGWTFSGPNTVDPSVPRVGFFGVLSDNLPNSVTRYTDSDGTLRPGDGAYTDGGQLFGYPLATNNNESRPVVLDRPFRSVAEMGYASRDIPWKHIDFFSKESGDAELLDLFCVSESSPLVETYPNAILESGKVDLNTPHKKILQAVLINSARSEGSDTVSQSDAEKLAESLVALTKDPARGPLRNRSELVSQWAKDLSYTSAKDTIIKRRRESAIRALSDVGNTRTWNLLIDVVAQTGRPIPANNSPFQVEGEQRCWVHVVIDRPTGKVISKFSELVYE